MTGNCLILDLRWGRRTVLNVPADDGSSEAWCRPPLATAATHHPDLGTDAGVLPVRLMGDAVASVDGWPAASANCS